jgi:hypothetical protein
VGPAHILDAIDALHAGRNIDLDGAAAPPCLRPPAACIIFAWPDHVAAS